MVAWFPYEYIPLANASAETRLLWLPVGGALPGRTDVLDECGLEPVSRRSLADKTFFAVSYTWGDASSKRRLILDGRSLEVPSNTFSALQSTQHHFRASPPGRVRVWVDAVCINQQDDGERSRQVMFMGEVYSAATETMVWLGGVWTDFQSSKALTTVHAIFCAYMRLFGGKRLDPDITVCDWPALNRLYTSPWFVRVWTTQEASMSRAVVCLFEGRSLPLYEVLVVAHQISESKMLIPHDHILKRHIRPAVLRSRFLANASTDGQGRTRMLTAVEYASTCDASNPRDKFYGILGFTATKDDVVLKADHSMSSQERPNSRDELNAILTFTPIDDDDTLKADYNMTVQEVYARATVHCMQTESIAKALQLASNCVKAPALALPTWAMGFTAPRLPALHRIIVGQQPDLMFSKTAWQLEISPRISHWKDLRLRGTRFEVIRKVMPWRLSLRDHYSMLLPGIRAVVRMAEGTICPSYLPPDLHAGIMWNRALRNSAESLAGVLLAGLGWPDTNDSPPDTPLKRFGETGSWLAAALRVATDGGTDDDVRGAIDHLQKTIAAHPEAHRMSQTIERAVCVLHYGHIGLCPLEARPGDWVCYFDRTMVPFVLRNVGEQWKLIGEMFFDRDAYDAAIDCGVAGPPKSEQYYDAFDII